MISLLVIAFQDDLFGASAAIAAGHIRQGCEGNPHETGMTRMTSLTMSQKNGRASRTNNAQVLSGLFYTTHFWLIFLFFVRRNRL